MSRLEKTATALYRGLLGVLPSRFRHTYAVEMLRMFEDRQQRARNPDSVLPSRALLRLWRREFSAVVTTALRARFGHRVRSSPAPTAFRELRAPERTGPGMDSFVLDLRTAIRSIRVNRASTAVAVLALGLGIGANSAIFSVVYGVLQPLRYSPSRPSRPRPTARTTCWRSGGFAPTSPSSGPMSASLP